MRVELHSLVPGAGATGAVAMITADTSKRWFELSCRRCSGRFVEMKDLLFHRCPWSEEPKPQRRKLRRAKR